MKFLEPDKVYDINGVTVKDYFLTEHNPYGIELPKKRKKPLLGITIHNTEAIAAAEGTTMSEQYSRATVYGNMGTTRVHYYVDDTEAWHDLPDNWCGWHAADGAGDGNTATIAIEVIGKSARAEENAVKLAAGLLKTYGLSADCLYTHSHWLNVRAGCKGSREYLNTLHNIYKNCPAYILPHWDEFEKRVAEELAAISEKAEPDKPDAQDTLNELYRIQLGAFKVRENAEKFLETVKKAGFDNAFITAVKK